MHDFYQIFMHVAHVVGSVLPRHVYHRPHRLSAGRGDGSAQRGRSVIYDRIVHFATLLNVNVSYMVLNTCCLIAGFHLVGGVV